MYQYIFKDKYVVVIIHGKMKVREIKALEKEHGTLMNETKI